MVMAVKNPQIAFQGQYEKLDIPQMPHTEYPKALYATPGGPLLGIVNNLKEEHELLEAQGIDHDAPDPLEKANAELAELRAKLAQYEKPSPVKVAQPTPTPAPATVVAPAPRAANPLLQPAPASAAAQGPAAPTKPAGGA